MFYIKKTRLWYINESLFKKTVYKILHIFKVFDGVKRLSSVYIKLHDAGCVLFKTWQTSFICDPKTPVCARLEFGQGVEMLKV